MIKTWEDLDPNEIVTKSYLDRTLDDRFSQSEARLDKKIDKKFQEQLKEFQRYTGALLDERLQEQLKEFQRYTGALAEEFHSRLSAVAEIVLSNKEEIIRHREVLKSNNFL